jgi:hypothetical protein
MKMLAEARDGYVGVFANLRLLEHDDEHVIKDVVTGSLIIRTVANFLS